MRDREDRAQAKNRIGRSDRRIGYVAAVWVHRGSRGRPPRPAKFIWGAAPTSPGPGRLGWRYDGAVTDLNKLAHRIVEEATDPDESSPTPAQTNGRNGGLKGGKARAAKLSPEKRSEIARKAARARWGDTAQ